jgi:hypothetical protein
MGLMDKAKEAALKAKESAQHAAQQGQAKVAEIKESRGEGDLYKTLGTAFFNEQRRGGSHEDVVAALDALDAHFAAEPAPAPEAAPGPNGDGAPPPPPAAGTAPPAGNFTLDDV